jgi:hypothetical protein
MVKRKWQTESIFSKLMGGDVSILAASGLSEDGPALAAGQRRGEAHRSVGKLHRPCLFAASNDPDIALVNITALNVNWSPDGVHVPQQRSMLLSFSRRCIEFPKGRGIGGLCALEAEV